VLGQQGRNAFLVADVSAHKHMVGIAFQAAQVIQIACVGQAVEIDDFLVRLRQPVEHEITTDEAGTAGYQNCHMIKSS
jgi:hypothetical protein